MEAELQGKDTIDPNTMKMLGERINALGKPINRNESVMTAALVSSQLMRYYVIAVGIWGLVFKKSFLAFGLYGAIVGFIISLLSIFPVVVCQRTKERIRNMVDGISLI